MKKMYKKLMNYAYIFVILITTIIMLELFRDTILINKSGTGFTLEVPILILGSILLFALYKKIYTYINKLSNEKSKKLIRIGYIVYFLILLFVTYSFTVIATVDLTDIIKEVNQLLANGKNISNIYYFSMYSNNKAILMIIYYIFKIGTVINVESINQFAALINSIGVFTSVFLIVKSVQLKKDSKQALFTLILFILCPVLYLYSAYFYTDTLVLPFASAMIYLITLIDVKENTKLKKIIFLIFLGFFSYLSFKIRATAFFILIAYFIILLYKKNIKSYISTVTPIIIGIVISLFCYTVVEKTFNFNYQEKDNFPATHWVMMGLNQEHRGRWNWPDVAFSESAENKAERQKMNIEVIKERLTEPTAKEIIELFKEKLKVNWAYGENQYTRYYKQVENYNSLYEYVVGNKQYILAYILQINRIVLVFMIIITLFFELKYKEYDYLIITLLGGFIFYFFWEVYERYSICFIPIMILISTKYMSKYLSKNFEQLEIKTSKKHLIDTQKITKYFKIATIIYSVFVLIINYNYYTEDKVILNDKSMNTFISNSRSLNQSIELNNNSTITQQIVPDKNFNKLNLVFIKTHQESEIYYLKLYDSNGKKLEEHAIYSNKIKDKVQNTIMLKNKYKTGKYEIELSTSSTKGIKLSCTGNDYYDYYTKGNLFQNDKEIKADLVMVVENNRESTRLPKIVYLIISASLLLLEAFLFIDLKKYFKLKEDK